MLRAAHLLEAEIIPKLCKAHVTRVAEAREAQNLFSFFGLTAASQTNGQVAKILRLVGRQLSGLTQAGEAFVTISQADRKQATRNKAANLPRFQFQRAAIVLGRAFGIPLAVGVGRLSHEVMIASIIGVVEECGGEATPGFKVAPAAQHDLGKAHECFFRELRAKLLQPCQSGEQVLGVEMPAQVVESAGALEKMVGQVERPAHGAASVQVVEVNTLRRRT